MGDGIIDSALTRQKMAEGTVDIPLGGNAPLAEKSVDSIVLKGEGIVNVTTRRASSLGAKMTPEQAAGLAEIVGTMFNTLQNIVKNIAPSEQELEVLRRRLEELKQLQHDLTDRKIDEELARKTLANILADEAVNKFLPALDWAAAHINV